MNSTREYKVYRLQDGTVIDHIPHWKALKVVDLLDLRRLDSLVTVGIGLLSAKLGKKDLLKIEGRELSEDEMHRLALVAPGASVNWIRDGKRVHKVQVRLPERLDGLVRCCNQGCITRHEYVPSRFLTESRTPIRLRCHYCTWVTGEDEIELL